MVQRRFALACRASFFHARQQRYLQHVWQGLSPLPRCQALRPLQIGRSFSAAAESKEPTASDSGPTATSARVSAQAAASDGQEEEVAEDGEIPPEVTDLFDTLRGEALRRLDEFGPIHLFSLCWAYSTARLLDDDLQKQVTDAALRLGRERDRDARPARRRGPSAASEVAPPPPEPAKASQEEAAASPSVRATVDIREPPQIIAQTAHWMALYKPPYWLVSVDSKEAAKAAAATPFEDEDEGDGDEEPASEGGRRRPRIHMWIKQNLAHQYPVCTDAVEAHGLLHRLDAQTSGILLCAKTYVGAYWLRLQWCSYTVDKEYVCLVHGWVDKNVREVHKRIRIDKKKAENSRRTISTHCSIHPSGKPSYTELFTLAHLTKPAKEPDTEQSGEQSSAAVAEETEEERFSLVALKLHTGRTHQIRVHMLSIGHPLVCDSKYAEERLASDRVWCPRNFLHTYRLGFEDVPRGQLHQKSDDDERSVDGLVNVVCPMPQDLRAVLESLRPADDISAARCKEWISDDSSQLRSFEEYVSADAASADSADAGHASEADLAKTQ